MDVILLERIENLGQMGDVVKVRPGFARNYLLPQKKALRASKENREHFERQRAQLEAVNLKRREEAAAVAGRMQNVWVELIRSAGESGQLYGSVSARDIAERLTEAGYTVERQQVQIDRPIKSLGLFEVKIALHPEVAVTVTVNVARSADEETVTGELSKLHMPTLLIWGQDDVITPPEVAEEFRDRIPKAQLHFIDKCGHAPMIEHPEQFNKLTLDFLGELATTAHAPSPSPSSRRCSCVGDDLDSRPDHRSPPALYFHPQPTGFHPARPSLCQ